MIIELFARFTPIQRSLISSITGFLFYGSWAFWVNHTHGIEAAVKAACVQGSYSFSLTLVMTLLVESLYRLGMRLFEDQLLVRWSTILLSCGIIFSTSWTINMIAGTPEIFKTVILGYIIGGIYCFTYVQGLARGNALQTAKI